MQGVRRQLYVSMAEKSAGSAGVAYVSMAGRAQCKECGGLNVSMAGRRKLLRRCRGSRIMCMNRRKRYWSAEAASL
jgi:hypothetical protein